jgi:hypothetical protein
MSGAARMVTIEVRDDEATRILTDGEMPAPRRDDA